MKSTSVVAFDRIAALLRQRDDRRRIEGHTDNAPIHMAQFPSNWELSTARATEIVRLLIVRDGFAPERLSADGYAEYHPVAANANPEGRGMNQRVDIVILGRALCAESTGEGGWCGAESHYSSYPTAGIAEDREAVGWHRTQPPVVRNVGARLKR